MSTRTVLLVEDSEAEAQMLERGLRSSDKTSTVVRVTTTTEAEVYISARTQTMDCRRVLPDLVVIDVKVPPAGGLAFLKMLRSDERTRGIPVLMMSGQLHDCDVQDLYRSGANSYIDMPLDGQEFVALVTAAAKYWLNLNLSAPRS